MKGLALFRPIAPLTMNELVLLTAGWTSEGHADIQLPVLQYHDSLAVWHHAFELRRNQMELRSVAISYVGKVLSAALGIEARCPFC